MAFTAKSDVFNPEILTEAVQGVFAQKTAFMGSRLASLGVVIVNGQMPQGGPGAIGNVITVPYFGTLGEFEENISDGTAATPKKLGQVTETGTITRDTLAFEVTRWAQGNALVDPDVGDPYEESARQALAAAERAMDKRIITAAGATGVYLKDVYSSTVPQQITWDLCVDAKIEGWGDEADDDLVAILVHSQTHKDMMKLKDSTGRNLLLSSQGEGGPLNQFCGVPVVVSDRVPVTGSTMGAVTSSGTSPPVATLAGTPLGAWKLVMDCQLSDAANSFIKFSTDGGNIFSDQIAVSDDGVPRNLIDPNVDSRVGVNGKTGLTVAFASGTFNADNLWTSTASMKVTSMLLKRKALSFWYSRQNLALDTDKDILKHTDIGAMHLYAVAHRYRRVANGTKPGVVQIVHNVSGF